MKRIVLCTLLLVLSMSLPAQQYWLQIVHNRSGKYKLLHQGQLLRIERDDGTVLRGHFQRFNDTALFLDTQYVLKDHIRKLGFYRPYWYFMATKFFIFGTLYPGIAAGNRCLNKTEPPLFKTGDFAVSGIVFAIALISRQLSRRDCIVKKGKWRIKFLKKD